MQNAKWKKHVENIKIAKFEAHISKEWDFMTVWTLKRIRRFVWKKLLESKSSNIFHTNPLNFPKIQTVNLLLNARGLKLGHFAIFDAVFPFLTFFKLKPVRLSFFRKIWSRDSSWKGPVGGRLWILFESICLKTEVILCIRLLWGNSYRPLATS